MDDPSARGIGAATSPVILAIALAAARRISAFGSCTYGSTRATVYLCSAPSVGATPVVGQLVGRTLSDTRVPQAMRVVSPGP